MINSKVDILTGGTWKEKHKDIILSFLEYLNERTNLYVLKGGTALMTCYGLDRFSEDIDLDSTDREAIYDIVSDFCQEYNYAFRVAKDTDSVKRFMIHYDDDTTSAHPLKIEISYRRREISPMQTLKINGIQTYNIDTLCAMKTNAYSSRDKIRDLYDVTFIINEYYEQIDSNTEELVRSAFENKGLEQFDYLIETQSDDLINSEMLEEKFLEAFDRLGLIQDERGDAVEVVTDDLIEQDALDLNNEEIYDIENSSFDYSWDDFER